MRCFSFIVACFLVSATAQAQVISLFNGRNFDGWTFFLEEKEYNVGGRGNIADFATIRPDGVIELNPRLHGALMTERDYHNFQLRLEWRWPDPTAPRHDTGIFLRLRPPFVWDAEHGEMARMYMVQIQPGDSGDIWVLGYAESLLSTDPARSYRPFGTLELEGVGAHMRRHLHSRDAELPLGEWNAMEVTLNGRDIEVRVNGELVNEGERLADLPGRIGLESEYGTVQFRNITLTPLPD